jgi:low temperature requirement protein LtrA
MSQPHDARLLLWGAALSSELLGPALRYWTPGLGASKVEDWDVEGGHLAERCALFIIIALGESVLVAGDTFCDQQWSASSLLSFGCAFTGTLAMWWIYFDRGVELGARRITRAVDPGRLARLAYTYFHLPIVAGIILSAVGDELLLTHAQAHAEPSAVAAIVGGPLLYVVGTLLFKRAIRGWFQLSHLAGVALLCLLGLVGGWLSTLWLAAAVTGALLLVAVWESLSLRSSSLEAALSSQQ